MTFKTSLYLIVSTILLFSVFTIFLGAGSVSTQAQIGLQLPKSSLNFNPIAQTERFGDKDVTLTVDSNLIPNGSNCTLSIYPFGSIALAPGSINDNKTYNNGCSITLPANRQNVQNWTFKVDITTTTGQRLGQIEDYFMLFGPAVVLESTAIAL